LTLFVTDARIAEAYMPWAEVVSVHHVAHERAGWLLVRPDGYLAAAGGPDDGGTLSRWLDRWLVRPGRAVSAATTGGQG
jgi:hypothetical protein